MTCKDCVYEKKCANREEMVQLDEHIWDEMEDIPCVEYFCKDFKNKADFVEVVRCKDCKHKQELDKYEKRLYIEGCVACTQISPNSDRLVMLPNDFCSYGERSDT